MTDMPLNRVLARAFVYLRVSGKTQVEGDGFERQLLACQKFAEAVGYEIVEVFREEGVSGATELEQRPALSQLLGALEENGVKTVLIEKLDRLARDLMIQETILADMRKQGYTLVSVAEPDLCRDDPSRKLLRQIMGAISEYEKSMIVLKLRGARERKKAATGKCDGRKAFGEKPGEAAALDRIIQMSAIGWTAKMIAVMLNQNGFKTRSGKPWRPTVVAKIIARERAKGEIHVNRT